MEIIANNQVGEEMIVHADSTGGRRREQAPSRPRTPLTLVTGLDRDVVARTTDALAMAGTTLVHHDLSSLPSGRVLRTMRSIDFDGVEHCDIREISLEHGCVSCTLRIDLLPLLRRLHQRTTVERIVLQLDPLIEPEALCWSIEHVVCSDMPGFLDAPAGDDVVGDATIACVSESDWLDAASGDVTLGEAGVADVDDERTLAQVAVGQVAFADALVLAGADPMFRDAWSSARLMEVLRRLAPGAPIVMELPQRPIRPTVVMQLLRAIGSSARRGAVFGPHDPLLRGAPPLTTECGVTLALFESDRPFHPTRLHDALDHLLEGVICSRGRLWLASRSDEVFWLESAGGALHVEEAGRWLAAMSADERAEVDPERLAHAAMRWDERFGDRHSALTILAHRADVTEIVQVLTAATLTDAEMSAGLSAWNSYADPFGTWHEDPCADSVLPEPGLLSIADRLDSDGTAHDGNDTDSEKEDHS